MSEWAEILWGFTKSKNHEDAENFFTNKKVLFLKIKCAHVSNRDFKIQNFWFPE